MLPVQVWSPGASGLDLARLLDLDLQRYGAVVVNSPHNPTGLTAAARDLADLAERCAAAGTTLIVDQVSLGTLDPGAPRCCWQAPASSAVVQVGDVSKAFGLGGLRVGWCAVPQPALRARIAELRDVTSLANSAPSQHLAAIALENRGALSAAPTARSNLERLCALMEEVAPPGSMEHAGRRARRLPGLPARGLCPRVRRPSCANGSVWPSPRGRSSASTATSASGWASLRRFSRRRSTGSSTRSTPGLVHETRRSRSPRPAPRNRCPRQGPASPARRGQTQGRHGTSRRPGRSARGGGRARCAGLGSPPTSGPSCSSASR